MVNVSWLQQRKSWMRYSRETPAYLRTATVRERPSRLLALVDRSLTVAVRIKNEPLLAQLICQMPCFINLTQCLTNRAAVDRHSSADFVGVKVGGG